MRQKYYIIPSDNREQQQFNGYTVDSFDYIIPSDNREQQPTVLSLKGFLNYIIPSDNREQQHLHIIMPEYLDYIIPSDNREQQPVPSANADRLNYIIPSDNREQQVDGWNGNIISYQTRWQYAGDKNGGPCKFIILTFFLSPILHNECDAEFYISEQYEEYSQF